MTYKHLTIDELTMIESYYLQHNKPVEIANRMGRAIQTIYNVVNKFKQGKTALDYWHQYKENKKKCGRKVIQWNGNSFFDKFYKVQNFFPYAIPIVLDNEPPRM